MLLSVLLIVLLLEVSVLLALTIAPLSGMVADYLESVFLEGIRNDDPAS